MFRRLWEAIKRLWIAARSERASPHEIFWAVFIGAFIGCTPAVGLRPYIAVGIATITRKNRLFCYLGSHTSNWLIMPFIVIAEIQLAHRLRTGAWATLDRKHITEQAPALLLDWCIGTIPVGLALATLLGTLAWWLAKRRDIRAVATGETFSRQDAEDAKTSAKETS